MLSTHHTLLSLLRVRAESLQRPRIYQRTVPLETQSTRTISLPAEISTTKVGALRFACRKGYNSRQAQKHELDVSTYALQVCSPDIPVSCCRGVYSVEDNCVDLHHMFSIAPHRPLRVEPALKDQKLLEPLLQWKVIRCEKRITVH